MLLEREAVLAAGDALLRRGAGEPATLIVFGAPGVGTSAVVDDILRRARCQASVALARCVPSDVDRPHAMVDRLAGQLGPPPGGGGRHRSVAGDAWSGLRLELAARLTAASVVRPVLLVLEDAHWCDPDSLEVLGSMVAQATQLRVALLVSGRPVPALRTWADGLRRSTDAVHHELKPLSRAATGVLLARGVGTAVSPAVEEAIWAVARGSPAMVELLLDRMRSEGLAAVLAPMDLGRVGRQRSELTDELRPVVEAAAVLGDPFRLSLVGAVAGLQPAEVNDQLDHLFRSGYLLAAGPGLGAFATPDAVEAVRRTMSPARAAELHRRAYAQERDLGRGADAARHAVAADLVGDPVALATVVGAAEAALAEGAVVAASRLSGDAVRLAGGTPPPAVLRLDGDARLAAGDPSGAGERYSAALAADPAPAERIGLLRRQSRALAYSGDLAGAEAASLAAWRLGRSMQPDETPAIVIEHIHAVWQSAGPAAARRVVEGYRGRGELPDDPLVQVVDLHTRLWAEGDHVADRLEVLAQEVDDPSHSTPFDPVVCFAEAARYAERFDDDERTLRAALEEASEAGRAHLVAPLEISLAANQIFRGRPELATERLEQVRRSAFVPILHEAVDITLAFAAAEQGDVDRLRALLARVGETPLLWSSRTWAANLRAELLLQTGDPGASAAFLDVEDLLRDLGVENPSGCWWAESAIAAHLAAGVLDDAERVCTWLEDRVPRNVAASPPIAALAGRARLAVTVGDDDRADGLFEAAEAVPGGRPLVRARARLAWAEWLLASGRPDPARGLFREALGAFERADAQPLAHRCTTGLHRAGGRRPARSRRPAHAGLTDQERRVAQLAADGLLNREIAETLFISSKTVETHLSRAFDKLGVRSRRDLRGRTFADS